MSGGVAHINNYNGGYVYINENSICTKTVECVVAYVHLQLCMYVVDIIYTFLNPVCQSSKFYVATYMITYTWNIKLVDITVIKIN